MKEDFEKKVDNYVANMIKKNPTQMMLTMLVIVGRMCVEANVGTMNLKTECTLNNTRYEVNSKITVKKIKK